MKLPGILNRTLLTAALSLGSALPALASQEALNLEIYNPGEDAIFAVSSVLVEGKEDAILIDAQFSTDDARQLIEMINASGKRLTTIYISHGDPDYYFGLAALVDAFPNAEVFATEQTIEHIQETKEEKLNVWGPQLGDNAPERLVIPQPLESDTLTLEGHDLKIMGLDGPTPDRTFVWIPDINAVVGGIPVMAGEHVWIADTQTEESRDNWLATLSDIAALLPTTVVPGHFAPGSQLDLSAVQFTADYLRTFEEQAAKADNASDLIEAMQTRYPSLLGTSSLELSSKVIMGEMEW
ncbi:glyoxylase-like metal-dependent hydrolase (beta-lactamase superfamily II) [Vreelandella songnenensis]|uniref:Glyoxylase-like metal-dependent hydrolase (Beta-lactamase superfamily II) n=1 Tax=Vreelandella songnenensis TaxID=1176243 RepID=A0A2T0V210_9GAMM|nr:MBL fold metallo-hydrolase [Halomonas songnenensis]PRY64210.1 glyoxylase-like metal-dependent hydrolase (beta-lactamase superfamily II) [Halomonas songnenensis]